MSAAPAPTYVLDASVTAGWLLPDEHTAASARAYARLRRRSLSVRVPELWLWECSNIVANAVRRMRVDPPDVGALWRVLDAVRQRVEIVVPQAHEVRECLELAVEHRLSVYGGAYLWLAARCHCTLLTHDEQLADAARARGLRACRADDVA